MAPQIPPKQQRTTRDSLSTREALRRRGPSRRALSRHAREQRMRRAILYGGLGLVGVIAVVLAFGYVRENYWRQAESVATVYGEQISVGEVIQQTRPRLTRLDQQIALFRANNLTQQLGSLQFQRGQLAETTLREMIEERVIRREASRRGMSVTPDEVDEQLRKNMALEDFYSRPQPTPTPAPTQLPDASPTATPAGTPTPRPTATALPTLTGDRYDPLFREFLTRANLSEQQARLAIENELLAEKLRQAIGDEVPANREQVRVRQLPFRSEEAAQAALDRLQAGASFEQLAAQSDDRSTSEQGGDIGWLIRGERDPAFDEVAFSLATGQTSGIVQTDSGPAIIQVVERDPFRPVESGTLDNLRRRHFGDWLATATADPAIDRRLTPELSNYILQRAARRA